MRRVRAAAGTAAVLSGVLTTAGCSSAEQPAVDRVATTFEDAATPAGERCALLAPAAVAELEDSAGQSCDQALPALQMPGGAVVSTAVWGDDAQVRLANDTVFLSRGTGGWVVTGAACRSQGDAPYLCQVSTP